MYTKYQNTNIKRGHGSRPVVSGLKVHGRSVDDCLGFYNSQIDAYKALVSALGVEYGIPLECPLDESGELITTVYEPAKQGVYSGVVSHFHLTTRKWDSISLPMKQVLEDI